MAHPVKPTQQNTHRNRTDAFFEGEDLFKRPRKSRAIPILAPHQTQLLQHRGAPVDIDRPTSNPKLISSIASYSTPSIQQGHNDQRIDDRLETVLPKLPTNEARGRNDEPSENKLQRASSGQGKKLLDVSSSKRTQSSSPVYPTDGTNELKAAVDSSLDVYANKYVPLWLRAVNKSFAVTKHSTPLQGIDYGDYISHYAGSSFLRPLPDVKLPELVIHDISRQFLDTSNYGQFWHERLQLEYASHAAQYQAYNLYCVKFETFDISKHLFRVKIPGIREHAPRIDLGDVLLIRPLLPVLSATIAKEAQQWYQSRQGIAPGFVGVEHHGIVWSISRRDQMVILRIDSDFSSALDCNIVIPVQEHKCIPTWRAVQLTATALSNTSQLANKWLQSMLFPVENDGKLQTSLSRGVFNLNWYESELNYEQKRAVYSTTKFNYGRIPYLVSGPPGTGKTKTLVETALQLLQTASPEKVHILICAPSDAAADTILNRLATHLTRTQLFRLNNWTRSSSEVSGSVLPFCSFDNNNLFTLPDMRTLMGYAVVVTTCRDADMLVQARLTNEALSIMASQVLGLISPRPDYDPTTLLHWSALLLDEAAQATEPESLIPLEVVMPPESLDLVEPRVQVIMAGDEHQLGPRLATRSRTGHERSLFQRLIERDVYSKHPLSRENGLPALKSSMLPLLRPPFTNLIRNYRSHPAILSIPSALFYHDTLIPERIKSSQVTVSWPGWTSSLRWPVLFYQNNGADDVESVLDGDGTGAGSLVNRNEADIALSMVESFLQHARGSSSTDILRQQDVLVMSPFSAQVNHLRQVFRKQGLYDVNIGPLEAFQGLESRIVILCTTRTRVGKLPNQKPGKFVEEDMARSLGVIGERKRFNVAITRAKEGLIVIGNASCLTCTGDECWISFLEFCQRNNLSSQPISWQDTNQHLSRHQPIIGKLEKALNYAAAVKADQESNTRNQNTRTTKLKGTMIDLDDEMWRLRELQLLENSENIEEFQEEDNDLADFVCTGYDRRDTNLKSRQLPVTKHSSESSTSIGSVTQSEKGPAQKMQEDTEKYDRDPAAELERAGCEMQ